MAIAVYCLLEITVLSNHLESIKYFPVCVFFGTIVGYNFLKYFEVFRKGFFRTNGYYPILILSILAAIGFLVSFYYLENAFQKLLLISGFFVLIYPFLRKFGWIKLFLVSLVVTFITVYVPFQPVDGLSKELYVNLIQRFLLLISLLIPFEIMDIKADDKSLLTLPQLFGIASTKLFGILLVIPFIVLEFLKLHPSYLVLPIGIIAVLFIDFTDLKRNKYFTSFWVESVPVLWWFFLIVS